VKSSAHDENLAIWLDNHQVMDFSVAVAREARSRQAIGAEGRVKGASRWLTAVLQEFELEVRRFAPRLGDSRTSR
jgi:hypothetical protein